MQRGASRTCQVTGYRGCAQTWSLPVRQSARATRYGYLKSLPRCAPRHTMYPKRAATAHPRRILRLMRPRHPMWSGVPRPRASTRARGYSNALWKVWRPGCRAARAARTAPPARAGRPGRLAEGRAVHPSRIAQTLACDTSVRGHADPSGADPVPARTVCAGSHFRASPAGAGSADCSARDLAWVDRGDTVEVLPAAIGIIGSAWLQRPPHRDRRRRSPARLPRRDPGGTLSSPHL